jgi:hypothetical protein
MDRKIIEEIFKLGSDALYNTLNPDNGNVDDRYLELKEEAVKLFSIQIVSKSFTAEQIETAYDVGFCDGCEEARPAY